MDQLQRSGAKLIYDPQFIAHRRPRPTLRAFCKMLFTYGRGRAEQFRRHPTLGSALNFVPPLICLYLVATMVGARWLGPLVFAPLGLFLLVVIGQTVASSARHGVIRSWFALPLLIATPVFYGLGFWRGLTTRLNTAGSKPVTEVTLERMPL